MKANFKKSSRIIAFSMVFIGLLTSCTNHGSSELQTKINELEAELKTYKDAEAITQKRLVEFDTLDFKFYTTQDWDNFSHSHKEDIIVYNADGSITEGLFPNHIDDLKPMFVFAPDTKIEKHPVKFGSGDWTAVVGELEGTFTEPMPIGEGKTIPPTGKKFKLRMATIAHWDGTKMTEEYLFYDNQSFMQQIGLAE